MSSSKQGKKVLARKRVPNNIPLLSIGLAYIMMDYYQAPGWVQGVVWTLLGILTVLAIYSIATETEVDPFA